MLTVNKMGYNKYVFICITNSVSNSIRTKVINIGCRKYSFLVAYYKKVYLNGLHMNQQYIVGDREGKDEGRGKDRKERRR